MRAWGLLMAFGISACGLYQPPAPAWKPSEAMARSARMLKAMDRVEADLHGATADIGMYNELVRRHSEATQLACNVTSEHVEEISRLAAAQQKKREEKAGLRKKKHKQVAMAAPRRHTLASN